MEDPTKIQIESMALLKIIKHCRDTTSKNVRGFLLGVTNKEGTIEITNAIPFVANDIISILEKKELRDAFLKPYKEVNADPNIVGWY
jgi:translation initiation factor 3 subunit H